METTLIILGAICFVVAIGSIPYGQEASASDFKVILGSFIAMGIFWVMAGLWGLCRSRRGGKTNPQKLL